MISIIIITIKYLLCMKIWYMILLFSSIQLKKILLVH